jgi:hypothetical protein
MALAVRANSAIIDFNRPDQSDVEISLTLGADLTDKNN